MMVMHWQYADTQDVYQLSLVLNPNDVSKELRLEIDLDVCMYLHSYTYIVWIL